jgi:tripartite-type tricarboxylate transporter receptor subunit TctC
MPSLSRRDLLHAVSGAGATALLPQSAVVQAYPSRPVRLVVPFPAGGATDLLARLIGQWLSDRDRQPFIIDNRPGAGGNIGTEMVVRAPPDGYTLLAFDTTSAVNATLYDRLSFNFIRDIAPVASIVRLPFVVLLHPSVPAKAIAELVAYAKANPGKINMASAGNGTWPANCSR